MPKGKGGPSAAAERRTPRLTPLDRSPELIPWQRARAVVGCELYWIPVSTFPAPQAQRIWLLAFLERLGAHLAQEGKLRAELFLQFKTIHPHLVDTFLQEARNNHPILGLSRRPGEALPPPPSVEDLKPLIDGTRKFDMHDFVGDYCYWFLNKAPRQQLETFLGYGGMSLVYLPPDAAAAPPPPPIPPKFREHPAWRPLFENIKIERLSAQAQSLADPFLAKSKAAFGEGLEGNPQWSGLLFIIPLLASRDFFSHSEGELRKWFEVFDVYLNESEQDGGILLASKNALEDQLIEIVAGMREEGWKYPAR